MTRKRGIHCCICESITITHSRPENNFSRPIVWAKEHCVLHYCSLQFSLQMIWTVLIFIPLPCTLFQKWCSSCIHSNPDWRRGQKQTDADHTELLALRMRLLFHSNKKHQPTLTSFIHLKTLKTPDITLTLNKSTSVSCSQTRAI